MKLNLGTMVIPAVEKQVLHSSQTLAAMKRVPTAEKAQEKRLSEIEKSYEAILMSHLNLKAALDEILADASESDQMKKIASKGIPSAEALRAACDAAELLVEDELWPLPKYREMLFSHQLA
jgi:glutamine synthetase